MKKRSEINALLVLSIIIIISLSLLPLLKSKFEGPTGYATFKTTLAPEKANAFIDNASNFDKGIYYDISTNYKTNITTNGIVLALNTSTNYYASGLYLSRVLWNGTTVNDIKNVIWQNISFNAGGFIYSREILINNTNNPNNLTDYQIKITLDTNTLISQGKMRSDCGDIRFYNSDGTSLPYWIESGCNTTTTKIWVKVPEIPASSTKTIYLYYGNLNLTSESNGTAVFDFFDDFNDGVIDTNKWYNTVSSSYLYEQNGYLRVYSNANIGGLGVFMAKFLLDDVTKYEIMHKVKMGSASTYTYSAVPKLTKNQDGTLQVAIWIYSNYYTYPSQIRIYNPADTQVDVDDTGLSFPRNEYHVIGTHIINASHIKIYDYKDNIVLNEMISTESMETTNNLYTGFAFADSSLSGLTCDYYFDWFFIKKKTNPEPTIIVENETQANKVVLRYRLTNQTQEVYNTSGLVAWYKLNENASTIIDHAGYDDNGTVYGATYITNGYFDGAYNFDGVNDYINIGKQVIEDNTTKPLTFEAWIYHKGGYPQKIIDQSNGAGPYEGYQWGFGATGELLLYIRDTNSNYLDARINWNNDNQWTYIAVTYDGSKSINGIKMYVNGKLQNFSTTNTNGILNDNTGVTKNTVIGARDSSNPIQFFNGIIDSVRIYNRVLTPEEIRWNYYHANFSNSSWSSYSSSPIIINKNAKYLQYEVNLSTNNTAYTPLLKNVETSFSAVAGPFYSKINIINPTNNSDLPRGKDIAGEDDKGFVDNILQIKARVYDNSSNAGVSANCSFWLNNNLLGFNTTDANGYCYYNLDKTTYQNGSYTLKVNYTLLDQNYIKAVNESIITFNISIYSLTLAPNNLRLINGIYKYKSGDAAILKINISKNNQFFDPSKLQVNATTSSLTLIDSHEYPGDIIKEGTGRYYSKTIVDYNIGNSIRWDVFLKDASGNLLATAIHADIPVIQADANLSLKAENKTGYENATIKIWDRNGYLLKETTMNTTYPVSLYDLYNILYDFKNASLTIYKLNITGNLSLKPQHVKDVTKPSYIKAFTDIIALNDTGLIYANATLTFAKKGLRIDKICYCQDWNYSTASCNGLWQCNATSDFNALQNATHIWFNVSHFTAYAGGQTYNANLTIWDETDTGMPYAGLTKYVNEQVMFFANYTNATSGEAINDSIANCSINFSIAPFGPFNMWFNATKQLWEYNRSFSNAGTYYFTVQCNSTLYDNLNATDDVVINESCLNLSQTGDDTYINQDTTLCKGTYYINDTNNNGVIIINASNIVLDGNGSTIVGNGGGYGISLDYQNVTIKNIKIKGYNYGIHLNGDYNLIENIILENNEFGIFGTTFASYNTLNNISAYNISQTGISLGGGSNIISNSLVNYTQEDAIGIHGDNNTLINTTVMFSEGVGVYVDGYYNKLINNTFLHNTLWDIGGPQLSSTSRVGGACDVYNSTTFINNTVTGGKFIFINNATILNGTWGEIVMCYADGSRLENITVRGSNIQDFEGIMNVSNGIYIEDSNNIVLNNISFNHTYGLKINNVTNLTFSNSDFQHSYIIDSNEVKDLSVDSLFLNNSGFVDFSNTNNSIIKNSIFLNPAEKSYFGVVTAGVVNFWFFRNITIYNNTFDNFNFSIATEAFSTCNYCSLVNITKNTIKNSDYGVYIENTNKITIEDNFFENNNYGIYLDNVSNVNITGGTYINNTYHIYGINVTNSSAVDLNMYINVIGSNYTGGIYLNSSNITLTQKNITFLSKYGKLIYDNLTTITNADTSNKVFINYNNITVLPDSILNQSATLYFYNVTNITNPKPYMNGWFCPSSICNNFQALGGNNYSFHVEHFTTFSIGSSCLTPTDDLSIVGSGEVYLCPGIYDITDAAGDGIIKINADNVILRGNNTEIIARNGSAISISQRNNVTIRDLNLSNNQTSVELSNNIKIINVTFKDYNDLALKFKGVNNSVVENSRFLGTPGDIITAYTGIAYYGDLGTNYNVTIRNNIFNKVDSGIMLGDVFNFTIYNNSFIDVYPNINYPTFYIGKGVLGNIYNNNFINDIYGIIILTSSLVNITNNTIDCGSASQYGIIDYGLPFREPGTNYNLINNTIKNCPYGIFILGNVDAEKNFEGNKLINNNVGLSVSDLLAYGVETGNISVSNLDLRNNTKSILIQGVENVNLSNITANENIIIENSQNVSFLKNLTISTIYGSIYYDNLTITKNVSTSGNISITYNNIYVNSSALPDFNKSATLTLNNLNLVNPVILKDGQYCGAPYCNITSYQNNVLIFNVASFTNYSADNNSAPTKPILLQPSNDATLLDRTPTFMWNNSNDREGDPINYTLLVDNDSSFASPEINVTIPNNTTGTTTSYTPASDLYFGTYYWKVIASDNNSNINESDVWNFTLIASVSCSLINSNIDFGTITVGQVENTTDNNPLPIVLRNNGNLLLNVSLNSTDLWQSQPNPSKYYQYMIDQNEINSYISARDDKWYNMTSILQQAITGLRYQDANDEAQIEIQVTGPSGEPSGSKNATITISCEAGE